MILRRTAAIAQVKGGSFRCSDQQQLKFRRAITPRQPILQEHPRRNRTAAAALMSEVGVWQEGMRKVPNSNKLKGILFDIDGTLVNSDPLHFLAWRELLLEKNFNNGIPITEPWFTEHLSGGHNPEAIEFLFPGISKEDNDAIAVDKEARFRKLAELEGLPPNAGVLEFFQWCDMQGLTKAAVTNAPRLNMEAMLRAIGLRDRFDAIVIGEECVRAKPHPDPYLEGAKLIGCAIDEVFAIEDSPSGVKAAVAGNIPVIALTVGHPRKRLEEAGADYIVDNFFQVAEIVKAAR